MFGVVWEEGVIFRCGWGFGEILVYEGFLIGGRGRGILVRGVGGFLDISFRG